MPLVDVNETTLHYRFDGPEHGPVVMLSNSLASDLSTWDLQIQPLTQAGFRVLRYDSRGHGQSAVPPGPYTMDMLTADAVGLMDAIGLGKIHFCGLSMGGMVGQEFGTRYGDRLISLMLCDTSAYIGPPEIWNERIAAVRENGMAAVVDPTLERWFTRSGRERLPAEVQKVRQSILNTPPEGFCACCAAIRDMDLREAIRAISVRTLVVVGEHDPGTPVPASELIHERIANSALRVIPDAAHFVHVEQADIFNDTLLAFLETGVS
ncbi:3-oxoadipate enol-lactonase [Thermodesulfobacteriota bacterium]